MTDPLENTIDHLIEPDERVHATARVIDAVVAVTDRRLVVATGAKVAIDIPWDRLRRVQLDIERDRPATLVLVPEWPSDPPQVLSVPPEAYRPTAQAVAFIAERLAGLEPTIEA
jgi:hypothetical protein